MTKLVWDQVGTRRFETGCDRGVLYLPNGTAVAWNGLTSVEEDASDLAVSEYYLDGVKYLNERSLGDFSGTLSAFTYPDEFLPFDGMGELREGVFAGDQAVNKTFGLSYRTRIGNDLVGTDYGYKIHMLYNLTAKPSNKTFGTTAASVPLSDLSWTIMGVPIHIPGLRPSCHIVAESTKLDPSVLLALENILYGTGSTTGALPDVATLLALEATEDVITELILEPL